MKLHINTIIHYFTRSSIQFLELFTTGLDKNMRDTNRYTSPGCCGLVLTLKGEATFGLNGTHYPVNKQTLLHAGPEMLIDIQTTEKCGWEYVVIHYKNFYDAASLQHQHFSIDLGDNHKIDYFVQQLIKLNAIPGDLMQLKCQLYMFQLIEAVLIHAKMQTASNFVDHAIAYIAESYAQQISVHEIAEAVGCERRKFAYTFEKQVGMSPIQYLTEYRLKQAKTLLRSTQLSVKEIAELVGYLDPYYFCRVFKKHFNMPPTSYRELS